MESGGILAEIPITTMEKQEAALKVAEYQLAVKRSHGAADRMMLKAYKALADGRGVINLHKAIEVGGVDPKTLEPRLAVMRADVPFCHLGRNGRSGVVYGAGQDIARSGRTKGFEAVRMCFRFNNVFPHLRSYTDVPNDFWWPGSAPVPPIPPALRPADALKNYVILWEVQKWERIAPIDPFLLKPIAGGLYAIVGHWDLTPIERMVFNAIIGGN